MELVQGNFTVVEYEANFTELARFAPHQVENEERKAFKFEWGLRPSIRTKLSVLRLRSYSKLVTRALIIEDFAEFQKSKEKKRPPRVPARWRLEAE